MYSPLNAMSKVHPPLAGEGCRGATVLVYVRGTSRYSGRQGGKDLRVEPPLRTMVVQALWACLFAKPFSQSKVPMTGNNLKLSI